MKRPRGWQGCGGRRILVLMVSPRKARPLAGGDHEQLGSGGLLSAALTGFSSVPGL